MIRIQIEINGIPCVLIVPTSKPLTIEDIKTFNVPVIPPSTKVVYHD